jgi:superfamily II DNA or RNA helicase
MDPYGAELPQMTLRDDQFELIERATKRHRGILQAPTGTGKTVLQMALRSCYRDKKTLILAHTRSIVQQTFSELTKSSFKNVQIIGAGHSHDCGLWGDTVVATMQSFVKIPIDQRCDYFQVIMVDEAHHVVRPDGVYAQILSTMLAPIRLGFTATVPTKRESVLTMEGLLGPVIAEQTIEEAAELKILARPKISLLSPQKNQRVRDLRKYADTYNKKTGELIAEGVYTAGIVNNRQRNRLIAETAKNYVDEGKTVLILVTRLEHGDNLQTILEEHLDVPTDFVEGKTDSDMRERIKTAMIEKEQKCVIATAVWREGINIPSLDVVINACGGKSEIMTLQAIGRGLRKTDKKDEVIIVDFIDRSHRYLSDHYAERMAIYHEQGWV